MNTGVVFGLGFVGLLYLLMNKERESRVMQSENKALEQKSKWTIPSNGQQYADLFDQVEKKYGMPKNLLARIAYQESRFNKDARGRDGEVGIMQIIERWHPEVKGKAHIPEIAIPYAGKYLYQNYKKFGSWEDAIGAYNMGPGGWKKYKEGKRDIAPVTAKYIKDVKQDVYV